MNSYPQYNTKLFSDVFNDCDKFIMEFNQSPFKDSIKVENAVKLFYLLYAKYGNSPIASDTEEQFKIQVFSIIFQYGATWEKRLEVQQELRNLTEEDIMTVSKTVNNHATNPSTQPYTASEESLSYIDDQQASTSKRGKVEAYSQLWAMLEDVTEPFLKRFLPLFKLIVNRERVVYYEGEE